MIALENERDKIRRSWPKEYYYLIETPKYIQIICKNRARRFDDSETFCKPVWKVVKK